MRKREEFAVSLRKENKKIKLNEKRAKLNTKMRPGMTAGSDLLITHECISDPSMSSVYNIAFLMILIGR
jgi:hypothetical protein